MKKQFVTSVLAMWMMSPAFAATPKKLEQFPEGERLIYARLVESFRKGKLEDVTKQRQLLERNFPKSVHLDNAYYLTGMLEFQNQKFGEALRSFGTVGDRFPRSNKRPASLFAKGITYKKLNLQPQAVKVWRRLAKEYPGSPESQRAWMHLQVEKQATRKN